MYNLPESKDIELGKLMEAVASGEAQLPEFQRNWRWDDNHIIGILASVSLGYPMGALMRIEYSSQNINFKYRPFEGANVSNKPPRFLFLDGQQRLTSLFRATCLKEPVDTETDTHKPTRRFYYFDINKCLDNPDEREEAILSIPEEKRIMKFNRDIVLDLSTRELEFKNEMFPINLLFGLYDDFFNWLEGYREYYHYNAEYREKAKKFQFEVIDIFKKYEVPVITLDKSTPKVAVCKVFENVNTGGVPLTIFELVTAIYASDGFDLRKDWIASKDIIQGKNETYRSDVLDGIDETDFLTAITLYSTYISGKTVSCKKKDVLSLPLKSYTDNKGIILEAFKKVRSFLTLQCFIYFKRDLPYKTQVIPLVAIYAVLLNKNFGRSQIEIDTILYHWFWCGILGEMYGSANETRFANDIVDVIKVVKGDISKTKTENDSYFSSTRLLTLKSRNSAAYKGIIALMIHEQCLDFIYNISMDHVNSSERGIDIHHIFPEAYCKKEGIDSKKWDLIINKTPLSAKSNRIIGGDAPSEYSGRIKKEAIIDDNELKKRVESNLINYEYFIHDKFDNYFICRAKSLLDLIEKAMGKKVNDKGSEETISKFGCSLE